LADCAGETEERSREGNRKRPSPEGAKGMEKGYDVTGGEGAVPEGMKGSVAKN